MDSNRNKFPGADSSEQAKKPRAFEVILSGGHKLEVREESIADSKDDAMFFLNLSDTEFPEPGPVVGKIYEKDEELKEEGKFQGKKIWDLMKEKVFEIPNVTVTKERDELSGLEYSKATFPSRPYEVMNINVTEANWPHLRNLYFGNIGPDGKGVLVKIWQPIPEQEPKLREELTTLLSNLIDKLENNSDVKSVAMPVLTGNRASSRYFYEVLREVCKTRQVSVDIVVYALKNDYEEGIKVLQKESIT
jgi:hypothetical protein